MDDLKLNDIHFAYRKAKVDAFYSTTSSEMLWGFLIYELDFFKNSTNLAMKLAAADQEFFNSDEFLGDWGLLEKSLECEQESSSEVIFSSARQAWNKLQASGSKLTAEFRVSSRLSVDFLILSALWTQLVGAKYDACLNDKVVYGNRLRRQRDGDFNHRAIGSLKPYLESYQSWRDNALECIDKNLQPDKNLLVLNADVSSFYHELDASFMLEKDFNDMLGITLEPREQQLHEIFIKALVAWAKKTPSGKGLPINIAAAAIISNLALWNLDRMICHEMMPLYYGRYVDDLIIVMENPADMSSVEQVFEWMIKRCNGSLHWQAAVRKKTKQSRQVLCYHEAFLNKSAIRFNAAKTKLFVLQADSSPALLATLQKNINQRGSIWRMLPQTAATTGDVFSNFAKLLQQDGQTADVLRRAEGLSVQRVDFAVMLRDFETVSRDLHPNSWQKQRRAFLQTYVNQMMVLPHFFEFSSYLERMVGLATSCGDYAELKAMVEQVLEIIENVKSSCVWKLKAAYNKKVDKEQLHEKWRSFLIERLEVAVLRNIDYGMSEQTKELWDEHLGDYFPILRSSVTTDQSKVILKAPYVIVFAEFFYHADLAAAPLRQQYMPEGLFVRKPQLDLSESVLLDCSKLALDYKLRCDAMFLAEKASIDSKQGLPSGLCFPTRPPGFGEISLLCQPLSDKLQRQRMVSLVGSLRGYNAARLLPSYSKAGVMNIKYSKIDAERVRVALLAIPEDEQAIIAAANACGHYSHTAYQKLTGSINELLQQGSTPQYLLLPELCLPAHLFMRLALKLAKHGTSLVAGLEYVSHGKNCRANPQWSSFVHDALDFNSIVTYCRDKQFPCAYESELLHEIGGKKFKPRSTQAAGIINHGGVYLSVLAAGEIANLDYRRELQGKVDVLLCSDLSSGHDKGQLLQQAARDIGCYIFAANGNAATCHAVAPCNSGRLEATPQRSSHGYFWLEYEVDLLALRRYQTGKRGNPHGFSALPPGFALSSARKKR